MKLKVMQNYLLQMCYLRKRYWNNSISKTESVRCLSTLGFFHVNITSIMPISCKYQDQIIGNRTDTVSRNTNGYPTWVINQVFQQIKVKCRYPVPNSNVSNETTQTSNQITVEKHDDKKHLLMISYQGERKENRLLT